eukprot:m.43508 g.43508  ORF g.43508 m.43508 type:complete len:541 (-) comp14747_c0_seq1:524-2146(-)
MPSGYLKNTEGVSERTGRGSSSKDGKTVKGGGRHSPQHSPKGCRLSTKPTKDGSNGGSGAQRGKSSGGGGDGAEGTSDIGGASGSSGRRSSPKFRGPAASNPTKSLVREVDRDVEPTAVAHARVTGLRLKASACIAAFEDFDTEDTQEITSRVDCARTPLVAAVQRARESASALDEQDLATSRAYGELRVAETTLEAFDSVPAAQFAKRDPLMNLSGSAKSAGGVFSGKTYQFTTIDTPDWAVVTKWKRLQPSMYDPASIDLLGEPLGDGSQDPVVELSCTTPSGIRCVFRESVVRRCLQSCPKCPTCAFQFAIPGPQPTGTLTVECASYPCEGYPKSSKTITMFYSFSSGKQGPRMKRPGQQYYGTTRCVYLPDNADGQAAASLLIKAFMAGGLFVVADSVTTGAQNCVVWGGVHQKTSPSGGAQYHGWPDPTYFERLLYECAAVGVFTDKHEKAMLMATNKAKKAAAAAAPSTRSVAPVAASSVAPPSAQDDETMRLQARIEELGSAIQVAMKARQMDTIRGLMAERTAVQAELKTRS